MSNFKANKTHSVIQGSTIVSRPIRYWIEDEKGNKSLADLSNFEVSIEIKNSNSEVIHQANVLNGIIDIPANMTNSMNGYYYCNIIIRKGNFVDRNYYLGIIIKERP